MHHALHRDPTHATAFTALMLSLLRRQLPLRCRRRWPALPARPRPAAGEAPPSLLCMHRLCARVLPTASVPAASESVQPRTPGAHSFGAGAMPIAHAARHLVHCNARWCMQKLTYARVATCRVPVPRSAVRSSAPPPAWEVSAAFPLLRCPNFFPQRNVSQPPASRFATVRLSARTFCPHKHPTRAVRVRAQSLP